MSEKEAWSAILPLAQEVRKILTSWKEHGTSYLVGRGFWNPGDRLHERTRETMKTLPAPGGT